MQKVTILRNHVQTGQYVGKKGETIEVPSAIAKAWIEAKFAKAVTTSIKAD